MDFDSFMLYGDGKARNFDGEINYNEKIDKSVKENFPTPSAVQSCLRSTVIRGRNAICITPYSLGKTLGYVVPILNTLLNQNLRNSEKFGPVALILVPSWKTAEIVAKFCRLIVKELDLIVLYGGEGEERDRYPLLLNGCTIVVATPPAFLRAIDQYIYTNLESLRHLIFDDVDILLETFDEDVKKIFTEINISLAQRVSNVQRTLQILACGKHWTNAVEQFYVELKQFSPILIVHPWLEASVFANIPTKIRMLKQSDKKEHLFNYVKSVEKHLNVIVCCSNSIVVDEIVEFLIEKNINATSSSPAETRNDKVTIVCVADTNLAFTTIDNAEVLIHYDLGECDIDGKTLFERRWILMHRSITTMNVGQKNNSLRQIFFIDETNAVQSPDVERYLKRLNVKIPKKLSQLVAGRVSMLHRERERFQLCSNLKCFGRCPNEIACKTRHNLMPIDRRAEFLPMNGEICVNITNIVSAQRFFGRLVSSNVVDDLLADLNRRLCQAFRPNSMNFKPQVGELCIFMKQINDEKMFFRCKLLNFTEKLQNYVVQSIDEGWINVAPQHNVRPLPYELSVSVLPPFAVEIILCSVKPLDDDLAWPSYVCRWVDEQLLGRRVRVGVKFSLNNTVWAERVVVTEKTSEKIWLTRFDLQKTLLERKFASLNEKHLKLLRNLIDSVKILSENDTKTTERKCSSPTKLTFVFDSLPIDGIPTNVVVTSVESPNSFYVRKFEHTSDLINLENELSTKIKSNSLAIIRRVDIVPGLICAASFNGAWQRAVVWKCLPDNECYLYFVDDGDYNKSTKNDSFYYLPDSLIARLPALAIHCSLACHPKSSIDDDTELGNILWTSTRDDEFEGITLSAVVVDELMSKNIFGMKNFYEIRLKKCNGDDILPVFDEQPTCQNVSTVEFNDNVKYLSINGDWNSYFDESEENFCMLKKKKVVETVAHLVNDEEKLRVQNEIVSNLVAELIDKVASMNPGLPKLKKCDQKWLYCSTVWRQSKTEIRLSLMLNDVKTFQLRVSDRKFYFCTTLPIGEYKLMLKFFSSIVPSSTTYETFGNRVVFYLKKILPQEWPRLVEIAEKLPYVRFDYASLDEPVKANEEFKTVAHENIFETVRKQLPDAVKSNYDLIGDVLPPEAVPGLIPCVPGSDDDDDASSLDSGDESYRADKFFV